MALRSYCLFPTREPLWASLGVWRYIMGNRQTVKELTQRAKDLLDLSIARVPDLVRMQEVWRVLDETMEAQDMDIDDLNLSEEDANRLNRLAYNLEFSQVVGKSRATPLPPPPTREEMAAAARAKKARKQAIY